MSGKKGDWTCHCGMDNFGRNDKCYRCDDFKSKTFPFKPNSAPVGRVGDWTCSWCNMLNFAKRIQCKQCSKERYTPVASSSSAPLVASSSSQVVVKDVPAPPMEPGDWFCTNCKSKDFNFKKRQICRHCNVNKNAVLAAPTVDVESSEECVICMDAPRSHILPCGHYNMCKECCIKANGKCYSCDAPFTIESLIKVYKS